MEQLSAKWMSPEYAVEFIKILLTTSVLFGVFFVLVNALQAMGAAFGSLIVNLSLQGIICIPLMFILQIFLKEEGLVWAQPVADLLSLALVAVLYLTTVHKLEKQSVMETSCV